MVEGEESYFPVEDDVVEMENQSDDEDEEAETDSTDSEAPTEKCPLCPRVFTDWCAAAGHIRYQHLRGILKLKQKAGTRVECPDCPKSFGTVNSTLSHVYTYHKASHFSQAVLLRLNRWDWKRYKSYYNHFCY